MMYYYIYQITNLVNNKIYVGVHKTKLLDDGYMGSGKVIKSAIKKYGLENFKKDILEYFEDSKSMYAKEKEIVTDSFLLREDTYNLKRGGNGGFDYLNANNLRYSNLKNPIVLAKTRISFKKRMETQGKTEKEKLAQIKANQTKKERGIKSDTSHMNTLEANIKRKETFSKNGHQQGEKNSGYGTMWITDGINNGKIKKSESIPNGWRKGRKIKQ